MKGVRQGIGIGCWLLTAAAGYAQDNSSSAPLSQSRTSALPQLVIEDLTATRNRPLFAPNRRPQPPAAPAATIAPPPQPAKPKPDFVLRGIITEGSLRFALLEDMNAPEPIVVRSGERIGPWLVMVDTDQSVTLVGEGEQIRLQMFEERRPASE